MRVVLVTAHWPPRLSGHGDYSERLVSSLLERDVDVHAVVLDDIEPARRAGEPVSIVPFPATWRTARQAVDAIVALAPDVICLQFEANAFRLRALPHVLPLWLRLRRQYVVLMYHELWPPTRFGRLAKFALLQAPQRAIGFSAWHRDGINRFRRFGRPTDVIAAASNISDTPGNRILLRTRYGIPADTIVLTFFGFILPEHHVAELLDAVGLVRSGGRQVELSVVGAFDPVRNRYHRDLQARSRSQDLEGSVTFHGRVDDDRAVARLLAISDLGVLPYDTGVGENNGAFAAFSRLGVPVVTTSGDRSRRMEQEGVAEFAEPTPADLASSVGVLIDDVQARDELAKRARLWSERRTWARVADGYMSVFGRDSGPVEIL